MVVKDPTEQQQGSNTSCPIDPGVWIGLILVYFLLGLAVLIPLLVKLWPLVSAGTDPVSINLVWGLVPVSFDQEAALFILAAVAGGLGSFLHAAQSMTDYIGNRRFQSSWASWYLMRLPIGAVLALIFYFVVRAGLISTDASSDQVNPFGVVALGALAGLFSKQATDKLREVFETLFRVAAGHGDDERADSLTNPRPLLERLNPHRAEAGAKHLRVRLSGKHFVKESRVRLNGHRVDSRLVDEAELQVNLEAEQLKKPAQVELVVSNPHPGGGESDPLMLEIAKKRRFRLRR